MRKGEVTAFLSLVFILMLSLVSAVIESASVQAAKNKRRGDMDRAIESVFAEYEKTLLEEYDIFAFDGGYRTGEFSEEKITDRLSLYSAGNIENSVESIQFLTDDSGRAFQEQAIACMKHKMGLSQLEELAGSSVKWEDQEQQAQEYEREENEVSEGLESSLGEAGKELPKDDNPIEVISDIRKSGLLNVVVKNQAEISNKKINPETLPSHRQLQRGKGNFKVRADTEGTSAKLFFGAYQLEKFAAADKPEEDGALSYELEYIIAGKESDRANLEAVVRKLTALRLGPNYAYLLTDQEKKAEAGALALTFSGIIAIPALTEVIKQGILLAWSFGESIMDIRTLLGGGKVEAVKTKENWQLQLSSLLKLGTDEDKGSAQHSERGLSYKEYLRILLFMNDQKLSAMRSLDIVESNVKRKAGAFFKADLCVSKMELRSRCSLRRGAGYEFVTYYGYQ